MRHGPPIFRRPDSPYWWTWIYPPGRGRQRISTRCTDRKAAIATAAALQREAISPSAPSLTVAETINAYLHFRTDLAPTSLSKYSGIANIICDRIGQLRTNDLTATILQNYVAWRRTKVTSRAVSMDIVVLSSALKEAKRRGEYAGNWSDIAPKNPQGKEQQRTRWLTRKEYKALCAAVPARHDRPDWITVACYTGGRINEINALKWEHVDFERELIRIPGTKNRRANRVIPLAKPLVTLLKQRKAKGLPLVRPWPCPYRSLETCAKRAGIEHVIPHDLRRTFASWLLQAGVQERAIADMLGHGGLDLVRSVYAHLGLEHHRAAIGKLR